MKLNHPGLLVMPATQYHAEKAIGCTGSDCLDTVLQLRPPFAWHKPDGLRRVT